MTFDADPVRWSSEHRRTGPDGGQAGRSETAVRVVLGIGVALLAVPVTLYVYLGLTLDLRSSLVRPDQPPCSDVSQDLVAGLCLGAGAVLAVGGLGLAVVSRGVGWRWWLVLGGVVAAYVVLLGVAISLVAP